MTKISRENKEMYHIFQDVYGNQSDWGDVQGMTGDYDKDIESFSEQWSKINMKIKQLKVDTDEQ